MNRIFVLAGALVFALGFGVTAFAQSGNIISVRSPDGKTAVKGELLEVEGTIYKIKTSLGVLEVDAASVDCTGEGCIEVEAFGESVAIVGSNTIGAELMPALILGYADSLSAEIIYEEGISENERVLRLIHETGKELVKIDIAALGSSASFTRLANNLATIGMSSRKIAQNEAEMLILAGIPDPRETEREHVLALDAVAIIVHQDNPLTSISMG
jgi:phosphate transport system substrate-binding protein